jgi:hypothetical protein
LPVNLLAATAFCGSGYLGRPHPAEPHKHDPERQTAAFEHRRQVYIGYPTMAGSAYASITEVELLFAPKPEMGTKQI